MTSLQPVQILAVTASTRHADRVANQLLSKGVPVRMHLVENQCAYREALANIPLDVIVMESLPTGFAATEALGFLQEEGRKLPFLMLTGSLDADLSLVESFVKALAHQKQSTFHTGLLEAIEENSSDGLFIVDLAGQIQYANRAAEKLCGFGKMHLKGSLADMLWAPASRDLFAEAVRTVLTHGQPVQHLEGKVQHSGGRSIPVRLNCAAIRDQSQISAALVTIQSTVELRRASADIALLHKQMNVERSHFETIMKQFPAGIVIAEAPSGRIVFFNDQAQNLMGADVVTATCLADYGQIQAFMPDGKPLQIEDWPLTQALESGIAVQGMVIRLYQKATDCECYLSLNAAPIFNSEGQITSAVLAVFDITAERQAHLSFVQAKEEAERANHAKTVFLANISHEIRTPLGAIIGFTSLLRSGDIPPEEVDETLTIIERNGCDLLRLIDEILDLSKVEAQKMEIAKVECSVSRIIRDVMNLLGRRARDKGLTVQVITRPDTPDIITTDPARLKQVLVNMIGNAIKFTEKGGIEITIGLEANDTLLIKIKDSGIGIQKDQRGSLFQPFSQVDGTNTRKFGGTGLGLLLSKKIAVLLGGNVDLLDSEPGVGSTFVVTAQVTPVRRQPGYAPHPGEAYRTNSGAPSAPNRLQDLSILAADDCLDNQLLLKSFLTRYGANVDFASNGLEVVKKHPQGPMI